VENKDWRKAYLASKRGHLTRFLAKTKERAKAQNLPHDIDLEYLESIAGLHCPVFGTPFVWGQGNGAHPYRPSVDRIIPELGYVKGNVAFISLKANTIKQDVTEKELYAVADWLHEARKKVNVNERPATPVSEGTDSQSEHDAKRRALLAARLREDRNHPDNHSGTIPGQDADHRAQASSGDSVGQRGEEMGTFEILESLENFRDAYAEAAGLRPRGRRISDKP
jgi:hypothetical protein